MKRLIIAALIVLLGTLLLSNITDTSASVTNTDVPDSMVTTNLSQANNSSASATITITWTTAPDK